MNYMPAHDDLLAAPDCPSVRGKYLDYDCKRAGRQVANLNVQVPGPVYTIFPSTHGLFAGVHEINFATAPLRRAFSWGDCYWDWDAQDVALLEHEIALEGAPASPAAPDDEREATEELVRWFGEHEAAAERSHEYESSADADDDAGEVILTRRGGLRSRAWRGGGTMRRR